MTPIRLELPTGLDVGSVNAYLFTRPEVVLVDAGISSHECWDALVEAMAPHGVCPADVSRVVITHAHVDHYGLAARITRESDATVWTSELGVPWITADAALWAARLAFYRDDFLPHTGLPQASIDRTIRGLRALDARAEPVPPERIVPFHLDGGLQMGGRPWRVLHTPGHASMQTCFYEPESRQLISADMLLAVAPTPVVEQPPAGQARRVPSLPQFLRSLDLLDGLAIDHVYPGHGRPFDDAHAAIQRQRERMMTRKEECFALIQAGTGDIPALVDAMYAHQPAASRLVGLWMLVGYLDLLEGEGRIVNEAPDGVWRFRANE